MAKKKRSRTSDFSLGDTKKIANLPSIDEINSAVAKATEQVKGPVSPKKEYHLQQPYHLRIARY